MEGWISVHRSIKEHWVWQDPIKFQWWMDILLSVNHMPRKVNIKNSIIECKRGQSLRSLKAWGDKWGVSKDKARNFLKLLESDGMIHTENMHKTTRLTVCNYDTYQDSIHATQTQTQRKTNATQTQTHPNNNGNKGNNENNEIKKSSDKSPTPKLSIDDRKKKFMNQIWEKAKGTQYNNKEQLRLFYEYWTEHGDNDKKFKMEKEKSFAITRRLSTWFNNIGKFGNNQIVKQPEKAPDELKKQLGIR